MTILKKSMPLNELQQFIKDNKGRAYKIESVNGIITKLDAENPVIIAWGRSRGLS